jgi:DNA-directed RNA polymerase specialized sigma24 family protein
MNTGANRRGGLPKKYHCTSEIDRAILSAYGEYRQRGDRTAMKRLAVRIGWPRWRCTKRVQELGAARVKEKPWCDEEIKILQRDGYLSDHVIARRLQRAGFERTTTAVHLKMRRLRIKQNLDGYTARALSEAFGIDVHMVMRWIRLGQLKAMRRGTERREAQGGDMWWIANSDVKKFVVTFPEQVDLAKVEKFWFMDLLTDGKICR